jgi:polar amino acid transport system substrate-binding protein
VGRAAPGAPGDRHGVHRDPVAVATGRARSDETLDHLRAFVEELKASGFVAESLRRAGRSDAVVAPPA